MDHRKLASELLRALRGKRSQVAFSRRLGYRSNIASRWEHGRCYPTAAETFAAASKLRVDVRASLKRFFVSPHPWLDDIDVRTPEGVAALLEQLRGGVKIGEIARELGASRFRVSRWLKGGAEPKLPEFLALVDVMSLRLPDFVCALVDPDGLPSLGAQLARQKAARDAAFVRPWSHAVLRALELRAYRSLARHERGFIAARLGISESEEAHCLALLERAGQIRRVKNKLIPTQVETVDLRSERERLRELKTFWIDVSRERIARGDQGTVGFNLFAVAERDLDRVRELYFAFYKRVQTIVARSEQPECLVLWNTQLMRLDRS